MLQEQLNALIAVVQQLPEIAKQLKIANELKAWELKQEYCGSLPALYDGSDEIYKILKKDWQ